MSLIASNTNNLEDFIVSEIYRTVSIDSGPVKSNHLTVFAPLAYKIASSPIHKISLKRFEYTFKTGFGLMINCVSMVFTQPKVLMTSALYVVVLSGLTDIDFRVELKSYHLKRSLLLIPMIESVVFFPSQILLSVRLNAPFGSSKTVTFAVSVLRQPWYLISAVYRFFPIIVSVVGIVTVFLELFKFFHS